MKHIISFIRILFLFSVVMMLFVSCGKDENDEPKNPGTGAGSSNKIEYYVKYESHVSIPSSTVTSVDVTVVTERGIQKLNVPKNWEGTFGPFNELTTLVISCETIGNGYNPNMTNSRGSISICRGNQPFILKADASFKGTSYTVKYTVTKEDLK